MTASPHDANGSWSVAAARTGTGAGLLADALHAYSRQAGAADTDVVFTHDQARSVREGAADVALMCSDSGDFADLEFAELATERPVALLPVDHHLANRTSLTAAELHHDPVFEPVCPSNSLDVIVDRVALGRLIVITGESMADRLGRSVTAVPVRDVAPSTLILSWLPDSPNTARTQFVETALATAAQPRPQPQAS